MTRRKSHTCTPPKCGDHYPGLGEDSDAVRHDHGISALAPWRFPAVMRQHGKRLARSSKGFRLLRNACNFITKRCLPGD
ncbi:hypothetical protein KC19_10G113200 [Ceratodon purpureus]|uniref:Uncharacterized protein n=1 Tax=Ceratodon purpureus TaxID=3225 RepID=A0A8T0GMU5_CERPU|nr:hypothetical protein KC19_10G113200 [Ceratodon purpureus]